MTQITRLSFPMTADTTVYIDTMKEAEKKLVAFKKSMPKEKPVDFNKFLKSLCNVRRKK